MGAALIVLILVGAGDSVDPAASSVRPALVQTARRPVDVTVREVAVVPDEGEAAWLAADAKVDVVVEVGWSGVAREHATVHLHGRDGRLLRASELDFALGEPRTERGRAVGFAIATMLADEPVAAGILASAAAADARVAGSGPVAPSREPARPAPTPAPISMTGASLAPPADRAASSPEANPRFAVEGAGSASADVRTKATGAGPLLRLQWNVVPDLGLRVGGGARWFTASGRSASELGAMTGVLWTFARGRSFAAGLRAELGVVHDAFTEEVSETNPKGKLLPVQSVDRTSWAPLFLAGIEGDWRPAHTISLFIALDVEASPRTIVSATVAEPSLMWASLEGGVRFSF